MNDQLRNDLTRVSVETLEKLAFLFAFPDDASQNPLQGTQIAAGVSFSGPLTGGLVIAVSDVTLKELTVNMLGLDDDEGTSAEQRQDALKEAINVVCGNLLPEIANKTDIFHIAAPQVATPEEACRTFDPVSEPVVSVLDVDGERCCMLLYLKAR